MVILNSKLFNLGLFSAFQDNYYVRAVGEDFLKEIMNWLIFFIYRYVKVHTKLNDLSHDEKFIIDSEIQTDLGAMSIKCILCEGKA